MHAAVQLEHVFAARLLVQAVDVLRDHGTELALFLHLGQLKVRLVGFGVQGQHLVAVKAIELLGVQFKERAGEDGLGRVGVGLVV